MRLVAAAAATALVLLGCASTPGDRSEDATFVCLQNDTEYALTAEIRDADTRDELGQVHVSGFGSAERWIRTGGGYDPVMVSVDAVGFVREWVPPAFRRILTSPGTPLSLTVGARGVTPFAHSSVNAGCRDAASGADSAAADSAAGDSLRADSATSSG